MAQQVKTLLRGLVASGSVDQDAITKALQDYAVMLTPWANSVAAYMVADVSRRDAKIWKQVSREIGAGLRREIDYAPVGGVMQEMLASSVGLIKSLPLQAAEEVHQIVLNNLPAGRRAASLIPQILELGSKTEARARLIARTEVSRTASLMTAARAQYAGSEGYIWRTVGDADVRESHAEMEGKYVRWDTEPKLSDGTRTHAGCIYNCRCFAEPVLPEE